MNPVVHQVLEGLIGCLAGFQPSTARILLLTVSSVARTRVGLINKNSG